MDGGGTEAVKSFSLLNFKIPLAWRCGLCFLFYFIPMGYNYFDTPTLRHLPGTNAAAPKLPPHVYLSSLLPPLFVSLSLSSFQNISSSISHNLGISMSNIETDGLSVTYSADRTGSPDLRLIHYNDVYHVEYALISPSFPSLRL